MFIIVYNHKIFVPGKVNTIKNVLPLARFYCTELIPTIPIVKVNLECLL